MPYGLNLMLRALVLRHIGDAVAALDLEPVIDTLRERVKTPPYPDTIRDLLIDNPHRVRLVVSPDTGLAAERDAAEAARLSAMKEELSGEHTAEILDLAARLQSAKGRKMTPILPRVELSAFLLRPHPSVDQRRRVTHYRYTAGTNGLVYQQWVSPFPPDLGRTATSASGHRSDGRGGRGRTRLPRNTGATPRHGWIAQCVGEYAPSAMMSRPATVILCCPRRRLPTASHRN